MKANMKTFFMLFVLIAFTTFAQPKEEVRAVWLTTAWGLDWPKSLRTEQSQKSALINILDKLKEANFNTIYFQVRTRGDVMYPSEIEPWAVSLTGTLGQAPTYDPLQFAIDEAHKRGMELHAWVVVFKVYGTETPPETTPRHVVLKHPELCKLYGTEGYYMDPGFPETRTYLLNLYMEMVRKYDFDAIHFDYIRYPGTTFNDADSYTMHGNSQNKADWRRENINKFVAAIYDSIQAVKPNMKVGSAPIGMYNFGNWPSYSELYQESKLWIQSGKHDYLAPQTYFKLGSGNPSYEFAANWWTHNVGKGNTLWGRHIYLSSAIYKMESSYGNWPASEVQSQIDTGRYYGTHGQSYFRTESFISNSKNITTLVQTNQYKYPANIPPMPWKDDIKPNAPENLVIQTEDSLVYSISWNKPSAAADGDTAIYYNIYMDYAAPVDISDIKNVVKFRVTNGTSAEVILSTKPEQSIYFIVTAYDKGYNESLPSNEAALIITSLDENKNNLPRAYKLLQNYPNPFNPSTTINYRIDNAGFVDITLYDVLGNEMAKLVNEYKEAGDHTILVQF
jgi:uncharacterized lipoprotein YddW (UPF0748 family)